MPRLSFAGGPTSSSRLAIGGLKAAVGGCSRANGGLSRARCLDCGGLLVGREEWASRTSESDPRVVLK